MLRNYFTVSFRNLLRHRGYSAINITGLAVGLSCFLLILLIACINFMNLNTAGSAHRAKEVGVRKVLGSDRSQLVRMFLSEAVLLSLLALILSIGIVELVLPWFNTFIDKELSFLGLGPLTLVVGGVFLVLLVGLMAGSYPAFVLAGAVALLIALATVAYDTIRAAKANPVQSLRYE